MLVFPGFKILYKFFKSLDRSTSKLECMLFDRVTLFEQKYSKSSHLQMLYEKGVLTNFDRKTPVLVTVLFFCEFFKDTFFTKHLPIIASEIRRRTHRPL